MAEVEFAIPRPKPKEAQSKQHLKQGKQGGPKSAAKPPHDAPRSQQATKSSGAKRGKDDATPQRGGSAASRTASAQLSRQQPTAHDHTP
jgi:hypothetical protein